VIQSSDAMLIITTTTIIIIVVVAADTSFAELNLNCQDCMNGT